MSQSVPEDIHAEKSLLATLCACGNDRVAMEISAASSFDPAAFVDPSHRCLWDGMVTLLEERSEINAITLKDALSRSGNLGRVGGYQGIVDLLQFEEVGNPEVLCDILMRKYTQRRLIRLGSTITRQAMEEGVDPEELMSSASDELLKMFKPKGDGGLVHLSVIAPKARARITSRVAGEKVSGVYKTRFERMDAMLGGGFEPGNLIILAARPGIGKTALVLNWLLSGAQGPTPMSGAIFSLEMSREEVTDRLAAAHAGIPLRQCIELHRTAMIPSIEQAYEDISSFPIWISDQASVTAKEIEAMVEHHMSRVGKLDIVVVDYLQLMSSNRSQSKNPKTEAIRIGEISRAFKLLAKEHKFPVVVLSQLNREVERREGGLPQLSDLRDSGAIEQDADIVAFIHRPNKPKKDKGETDTTAKLVIAKSRSGPTGVIPLDWDGSTTRYREVERTTDDPPYLQKKAEQRALDGWEHIASQTQEEPENMFDIPFPDLP